MNIARIVSTLPRFFRRHKLARALLFLSPESRTQLITFNGSTRLFADISDPFARSYLFAERFDPEFFAIAKPFLSNGGVFFDVGANFGFCTFGLIGCLVRNDIEYHLFEANANICQLLLKSAELYPDQDIKINHCCVTDSQGISKLNLVYSNFGASFISDKGTQEVKNLILDSYIHEHSIKKINLLKIDIEGWEIRALNGAMNALTKGVVGALYTEVSTYNLSRAGFSAREYIDLLRDAGFYLFYVRRADFESGVADKTRAFTLDVYGYPLTVAEMYKFPTEHLTDILSIHKSSEFLQNYREQE